ncbi:uncharacterized protein N0V89_011550 [Didymosphaeria variabile]|uniref:Uncharacterized protein n=1 Tax=Didymosphaeria variabile TaxID=1932322 RepID=A0A9W9C5G8_9PLEO|nr:uncharacterized protein N0V89_011550 [Didymosphaeria variabile]KAJ4345420.1 hypothetical protein N0V89_011550 [Didymosphaeria variabile]
MIPHALGPGDVYTHNPSTYTSRPQHSDYSLNHTKHVQPSNISFDRLPVASFVKTKFTTTIFTVTTLLVVTVSAAPTPHFGGPFEARQWGGDLKAGDKRAPKFLGQIEHGKKHKLEGALYVPSGPAKSVVERQFGGQVEGEKKHKLDGALYSPSGPAKPIVFERRFGGETDMRQFGAFIHEHAFKKGSEADAER